MDIKVIENPKFKPLEEEDLEVKVFVDEYSYDEEKDELFVKLKIKDTPFIVYREIVIPLRRGLNFLLEDDIEELIDTEVGL